MLACILDLANHAVSGAANAQTANGMVVLAHCKAVRRQLSVARLSLHCSLLTRCGVSDQIIAGAVDLALC